MQKQSIRKVYPRSVLSPREGIFIPREGIYFSPLVTNDMSVINKNTSVLMNNMPLLMNKVPLLMNKVPLLHHLQFVFRTFSCIESWRMPLMPLFLHDTEVSVLIFFYKFTSSFLPPKPWVNSINEMSWLNRQIELTQLIIWINEYHSVANNFSLQRQNKYMMSYNQTAMTPMTMTPMTAP